MVLKGFEDGRVQLFPAVVPTAVLRANPVKCLQCLTIVLYVSEPVYRIRSET